MYLNNNCNKSFHLLANSLYSSDWAHGEVVFAYAVLATLLAVWSNYLPGGRLPLATTADTHHPHAFHSPPFTHRPCARLAASRWLRFLPSSAGRLRVHGAGFCGLLGAALPQELC